MLPSLALTCNPPASAYGLQVHAAASVFLVVCTQMAPYKAWQFIANILPFNSALKACSPPITVPYFLRAIQNPIIGQVLI